MKQQEENAASLDWEKIRQSKKEFEEGKITINQYRVAYGLEAFKGGDVCLKKLTPDEERLYKEELSNKQNHQDCQDV